MDFMKQLKKWEAKHQFDKIIKALEKVKKRDLDQDMLLATAYIAKGANDWNKRIFPTKALRLMKPAIPYYQEDLGFFLGLSNAYIALNQYSNAVLALHKAIELAPAAEAKALIYKMLERSEEMRSLPVFKQPFESRVKEAWAKFERGQAEYANILSKTPSRKQEVEAKIKSTFSLAIFDPQMVIYLNKGLFQILFYTQGNLLRCFALEYLKEHAPNTFASKWNIQVGIPPKDFSLEKLHPSDLVDLNSAEKTHIWIEKEEDGIFYLNAYCALWSSQNYIPEGGREIVVLNFIVNVVGQVVADKYLRLEKVFAEPPKEKEKGMPLLKLPTFLSNRGINIYCNTAIILNQATNYTRLPVSVPDTGPYRQDIISGSSLCMKVLEDYANGNAVETESLEAEGISAGFLFYRTDNFEGGDREKKIEEFRRNLKYFLSLNVGEDIVKIIGEAHGTKFDYVDIIAWDLQKVLQLTKAYFSETKIPFAAYQVFRKSANYAILAGKAFWEVNPVTGLNTVDPFLPPFGSKKG